MGAEAMGAEAMGAGAMGAEAMGAEAMGAEAMGWLRGGGSWGEHARRDSRVAGNQPTRAFGEVSPD